METNQIQEKIKKESSSSRVLLIGIGVVFALGCVAQIGIITIYALIGYEEWMQTVTSFLPSIFNFAFVSPIAFIASKIFAELAENYTPFTESIAKRLQIIAIILSAMAVASIIYDVVFITILDFEVESVGQFGAFYAVIGIILEAASRIFKYGVLLQRQSDETL